MQGLKFYAVRFKTQLICIAVLTFILLCLIILSNFPNSVEALYSNGIYTVICYILHPVLNIFPFSVGDVFYVALVGFILYSLVKLFRLLFKKRFFQVVNLLLRMVIGLQLLVAVFYGFWAMNYFRPAAAERLNLQVSSYTFGDVKTVTQLLIDSANLCRSRLNDSDYRQTNGQIYDTAQLAIKNLSAFGIKGFESFKPHIKASLLTFALNYLGTEGYYNPFTSEAQINYQMPVFLRPFVACHEMSHQMGFGTEDEANFVGFIAGTSSKNKFLRYSAYYTGVEEFMHAIHTTDTLLYKQLKKNISGPVMNDFKTNHRYWRAYEGKLGILSSILYDNYLKVNNQPRGLDTYNQMVKLVMAWYTKRHLVNGK